MPSLSDKYPSNNGAILEPTPTNTALSENAFSNRPWCSTDSVTIAVRTGTVPFVKIPNMIEDTIMRIRFVDVARITIKKAINSSDVIKILVLPHLSTSLPSTSFPNIFPTKKVEVRTPKNAGWTPRERRRKGIKTKRAELASESRIKLEVANINFLFWNKWRYRSSPCTLSAFCSIDDCRRLRKSNKNMPKQTVTITALKTAVDR